MEFVFSLWNGKLRIVSYIFLEYMRKFTLPQGVNMADLKSSFCDGILEIHAALPLESIEEQPSAIEEATEIPISRPHHGIGHYIKKILPSVKSTKT